jgi:serum/glucocorticoid-regulated kinase 2
MATGGKRFFHFRVQDRVIDMEFPDTFPVKDLLPTLRRNPRTPSPEKLIGLKSLCGCLTLDFILTTESAIEVRQLRNQDWFQGIYSQTPAPTSPISIGDFTFEKCIGKGGTSDVFLGTLFPTIHPRNQFGTTIPPDSSLSR